MALICFDFIGVVLCFLGAFLGIFLDAMWQ